MSELKIDTDGTAYFNQYTDTHLRYGFNWNDYAVVISSEITTAVVSCSLSTVTYGSTALSSGLVHTFHVSPSAANAGQQPMMSSKVFFDDGQYDKRRIRIKVIS